MRRTCRKCLRLLTFNRGWLRLAPLLSLFMKTSKQRPLWRENEFPPNSRSTEEVYKFLRNVGGRNPYGENNYLAVIASEVRYLSGGAYNEYSQGVRGLDANKLDFDPEIKIVPVSVKQEGTSHKETIQVATPAGMHVTNPPFRTVKEMRWVKRWPQLKGWSILHWESGAGGCSRSWWEQWKVPGTDLQILGPWPERGMYWTFCEGFDPSTKEVTYSTFDQIPSHSWMERAIAQFEFHRNQPDDIVNSDFRKLAALGEAHAREQEQDKKERDELAKEYRDDISFLFSNSLAAGRVREGIARTLRGQGIEVGHVGN